MCDCLFLKVKVEREIREDLERKNRLRFCLRLNRVRMCFFAAVSCNETGVGCVLFLSILVRVIVQSFLRMLSV